MPGAPATQQSGPVKAAQGPLTQVITQAQGLYNKGQGFRAAPLSDLYSGLSDQTRAGLQGEYNYAGQGNPLAGQSQGVIGSILGGDTANAYKSLFDNSGNQAFSGALDTQAAHLTDDVNRQYSGMGRSGSVANAADVANQVGDVRNRALATNWNQNIANQRGILGDSVNSQLSAVQAAPGAWEQGLLPFQAQQQVGSAYDTRNQALAAAKLQQFNQQQQAPWQRLAAYSSQIGGPAAQLGTVNTQTAARNPIGGALGGGLLGAQAGYQMGGASGAGYGGLIGGLGGFAANVFGL